MSLKEYKVGEHPAGFIGYRVTMTFGWDHLRLEKYFSLKEFGSKALALAEAEHAKLKELSERVTLEDRVYRKRRASGPHVIADGFRAKIVISRKGGKDSFSFAFCVDHEGNNGTAEFTIKGDLSAAFEEALSFYAKQRNLSSEEVAYIASKRPAPELFTQYLGPLMRESGRLISGDLISMRVGAVQKKGLPTKADFEIVMNAIKNESLPIQVYFDKAVLFWRSRIDKSFYREFNYSEWGGIHKSFSAAKAQLQQFQTAERAIQLDSKQLHAADLVKLDYIGKKLRYRITFNGNTQKSLTFPVNELCADGQLHTYRTALTMAFHIMNDGYTAKELDTLPDWREFRIYESGMPPLPYGFWQRDGSPEMTKEEVKAIIAQMLKEKGLESLLIDIIQ